ncbi:hypothetical protein VNI00_016338 [Paramarasmius palmivorus]|uniref:Uncharacterized protein n=1 Tax=Paramarasmius palmivorus TaxID=297713 RepID=A0AAW0BE94_9AGAR
MSLVNLIVVNAITTQKIAFDPFPLVALSAGIAPTLIMVRAKLGMNVETMQETLSDIRFSTLPAQRSRWLGGNSTTQSQVPQVLSAGRNSGGDVQIVQLGCEPVDNLKETSMTV